MDAFYQRDLLALKVLNLYLPEELKKLNFYDRKSYLNFNYLSIKNN